MEILSDDLEEIENPELAAKRMCELYKAKGTVSEHVKHIFEDGELGK
jgi:hypothetical protein